VDPSPRVTREKTPAPDSPDEAGVAVAPDVAIFEPLDGSPLMMRCVTRTRLLAYLEDEDDAETPPEGDLCLVDAAPVEPKDDGDEAPGGVLHLDASRSVSLHGAR